MAAVKTGADPKRRADFLDSMEEEIQRVSAHLERRERRLGLKARRSMTVATSDMVNGYNSFSEGSGAEAGARRTRINRYPRQLKPPPRAAGSEEDERSSPDTDTTRSPSPPRSAPPDSSAPVTPFTSNNDEQLPTRHLDKSSTISSTSSSSSSISGRVPDTTATTRNNSYDRRRREIKATSLSSGGGRYYNASTTTRQDRDRRAASSSPLRSPPPVAPKPKSHRPRAGSAPPPRRQFRREEEVAGGSSGGVAAGEEKDAIKSPEPEPPSPEEKEKMEEEDSHTEDPNNQEFLEAGSTPVPSELSEQTLSPSLTPEPSESLLVLHQTRRERSTTPESSCSTLSPGFSTPSSSMEVIEARSKDTPSPGIIEISGHFTFGKKKTLERREGEGDGRESGLEKVEEVEEEEEEEEEEVESALLEAMKEDEEERVRKEKGLERTEEEEEEEKIELVEKEIFQSTVQTTTNSESNGDVVSNATVTRQPANNPTSDPRGLEVKTLPLMSPARGRKTSPGQQRRGTQELSLIVKELQLQLREKNEELGRQKRQAERGAKERTEQVEKLEKEAQKADREKWELLKRARDGAERALHLQTQLGAKEAQIRSLQTDLGRTRDEMMSVKSANTSLRALLTELRAPKSTKDEGVQVNLGQGTLRRNASMELAVQELSRPPSRNLERGVDFRASTTHLDRGANHRISNCSAMSEGWTMAQPIPTWDRSSDRWERETSVTSVTSSIYEPGSREGTPSQSPHSGRKNKKKKAPLFGKLRKSAGRRGSTPTILDGVDLSQSSLVQGHALKPITFPYHTRVAPETQENWRILDDNERVPFNLWNGRTVAAWVSTGLGMTQYVAAVRDHVATGNAMLTLSDSDMEKKLGVSNHLHRRKLRLAIEEKRRPDRVRYPLAGRIDSGWLSEVWISDIGLPQLTDIIAANLLDGRVLESLTKEDLKKYLKLKKIEQHSFLAGVELLRMHDYNRETIQEIRASQQSRSAPQNPLYWTNRDVADWIRDIQLGDYATNLLQTGVHGALLLLEKGKVTPDQLSQMLQLPGGKHVARKHLTQQLNRLLRDDAPEHGYLSHQSSATSFQSDRGAGGRGGGGNTPLSPPFSGSLYRAGSSPTLNLTPSLADRLSMEDRIRHSLRESALRSVTSSTMSPRTPSPSSSPGGGSQFSHPPSPHLPSAPSPLVQNKASSTTV